MISKYLAQNTETQYERSILKRVLGAKTINNHAPPVGLEPTTPAASNHLAVGSKGANRLRHLTNP